MSTNIVVFTVRIALSGGRDACKQIVPPVLWSSFQKMDEQISGYQNIHIH
jgi:hypothetical protein